MRDEIARLVYPVLQQGLSLRHLLNSSGPRPDFEKEQSLLLRHLTPDDTRGASDFMPEKRSGARSTDSFLGIQYALACWLDEIFILDSPWEKEWTDRKLETALFDTNLRARLFWEQARRAETRQGDDALEAFFLCVMLGFQGDLRDQPQELQAWIEKTRRRLSEGLKREPLAPVEVEPPTNVPPLRARDRVARMLVVCGVIFLGLIIAGFVVLELKG